MVTTDGGEEGRSPEGRRDFPKSFMEIPSGGEFGEFVGGLGSGGREGASQESQGSREAGGAGSPGLPALPVQLSSDPIPYQSGQ